MDTVGNSVLQRAYFCGAGVVTGLLLHHGLFINGEWHLSGPHIVVIHASIFAALIAAKSYYHNSPSGSVFGSLVMASWWYLATLIASIVVYRVFFHRLSKARFAGPWYARVTKLWHVYASRRSQNHLVLEALHEQYGDFVRTGPAEITVFHPDVFIAIDGPRSECIKAEWYDVLHPNLALVTARDRAVHAARRREWNRGFTSQARAEHNARVLNSVDELEKCIEADTRHGKASNARDLFYWFGFDAMGDFVFSSSFGQLRNRRWHGTIVRLQSAMSLLGPFSPVPWLVQVGFRLLPRVYALRDWFEMMDWCAQQMRSRLDDSYVKHSRDLTYYLMEQDGQSQNADSFFWLHGDSVFAIVAGSEPVAITLLGIFCELAKHPHHAEKILGEVEGVDVTDIRALAILPHLNAVINEALRLYPIAPTGGARKTTDGGIVVGGRFIPPGTTIYAPRYSIFRREDCFERATEFVPERWSTEPQLVRNAAAFAPFSTGHHSCLGRGLATDIVRYVTARIVKKYKVGLADGEDARQFWGDMRDQFTACPGGLSLKFETR
ncbi:cytochrome P450 [Xylariaceae sp. FL1651]|nr:cytochrome P450 [Xylariaceae sp. FL1651]